MIQANVAAAETLEKKKSPVVYRVHAAPSPEKLKNLKDFLDTLELSVPPAGQLKPAPFQSHPGASQIAAGAGAGQRGGAALAGPGRVLARQHRALRVASQPLRALHLADPPLRRSSGSSRPGARPQARRRRVDRRAGGAPRHRLAADLAGRAPRHGRRTRDHRPADRRASRRPCRRDVPGAHRRRDAVGIVRAIERHGCGRLRADLQPRQRLLSAHGDHPRAGRQPHRRELSASATRSKCASSRRSRRPARCASR